MDKKQSALIFFIVFFTFFALKTLAASGSVSSLGLNSYHTYAPTALQSLIKKNIISKKYKESLAILDEQIKQNPMNDDLLYQEALIYVDLEQYYKAKSLLQSVLKHNPKNKKADQLLQKVNKKIEALAHNEVGLGQDEVYVSDLRNYWSYTSLHYYRLTECGTFGGRVNLGHRFHLNGQQYQFEAYPKFNKMYINLMYAFSNTPQQVFPKYQYTVEPYLTLFDSYEVSLGQRFSRAFAVNIYSTTASLAKYLSNYFFWIRSYHYTPKSKNYGELGMRRYFSNDRDYISIKIGGGKYPDIGDIQPFTQLILVSAKNIGLDGRVTINKNVYLKWNIGYTNQLLQPSDKRRQLTEAGVELNYQF